MRWLTCNLQAGQCTCKSTNWRTWQTARVAPQACGAIPIHRSWASHYAAHCNQLLAAHTMTTDTCLL